MTTLEWIEKPSKKPQRRGKRPLWQQLHRYRWTLTYIGVIVLANLLLQWLPPVSLLGTSFPPAILASGFVFVLRDFVQKEIGHFVLVPITIAAAITALLAGPQIAIASASAFFVAELADWCVYSWIKRPLSDRVLISSLISVPVDTAIFYNALGILDPAAFGLGVAIKLVAAVLFWSWLRTRGR